MTRLDHLVPADRIAEFASRWKMTEMSLFSSLRRGDFAADGDMGVLGSAATCSLWDLTMMQDELTDIVGRKVDLVEKEMNPRRIRIQNSTAE